MSDTLSLVKASPSVPFFDHTSAAPTKDFLVVEIDNGILVIVSAAYLYEPVDEPVSPDEQMIQRSGNGVLC